MVILPLKYVVDHPAIDTVSTAEHDSCICARLQEGGAEGQSAESDT